MEIYSFTGKSGTGKSYQAIKICKQNGIDAIIDDGLLIYKNVIVAGSSAKKCESKAAAMRTTLFNYEDVREDVKNALQRIKPKKILILGTSDRMVDWITDALEIPRASHRIYIEDVTTKGERAIAARSRNGRGEHVIPAPMVQLKRDFAGYFINPQRLFGNIVIDGGEKTYERTVVRPAYSYFGQFVISENVLEDIIKITAGKYRRTLRVNNFYNNRNSSDLDIIVVITVLKKDDVMAKCERFQRDVRDAIEKMTAFSVGFINLQIKDIVFREDIERKKRAKAVMRREVDRRRLIKRGIDRWAGEVRKADRWPEK